jgi:type VI secretion system secreted protein VgrG
MATTYTQANSPMAVSTPLGPDKFLLVGLSGREGISQLFHFQLDLIADNKVVQDVLTQNNAAFAELLGKPVLVELRVRGRKRFIHGMCNRLTQGNQDASFTQYRLDIVPQLWLLTRRGRSRIFQGLTVPQILDKVFKGEKLPTETKDPEGPRLDVKFQWNKEADFKGRDYCVQYRETDYNFVCRLMEEEGIHFYFRHSEEGHQLCVTDFPSHPNIFEGGKAPAVLFADLLSSQKEAAQDIIYDWQKAQELRSGKYTLRDHCFEMQNPIVEVDDRTRPDVQAGLVKHPLKLVQNDPQLEIYDFPSESAQRFDGVNPGGANRPADLDNLLPDARRTVHIRMEEEMATAVLVSGSSNCPAFTAGHNFFRTAQDKKKELVLKNDGEYLLADVTHVASLGGGYRSGGPGVFTYQNAFGCVPTGAPFRRSPRATPKPVVQGCQTATVVGPKGSEIFTDKYGRVKVKFHWDRDERRDADSSCWVRVAQVWAGNRWGAYFWPRIGQEVVVAFLEGDPDQPIIVGSVYNFNQLPPYLSDGKLLPPDGKHKNDNWLSGVKSNSTPGGVGYNELRFDDTKGKEQVFLHAQHNLDVRVNASSMTSVGGSYHLTVGGKDKDGKKSGDLKEKVFQDKHVTVERHQQEHIGGDMQLYVGGGDEGKGDLDIKTKNDLKTTIGGEEDRNVTKDRKEHVGGSQSLTVDGDQQEKVTKKHALDAGDIHLKAGKTLILEAGTQISLKVGGNFVDIAAGGVTIMGTMVKINSGGAAGSGGGSSPAAPTDAKEAKPAEPAGADNSRSGHTSAPKS